MAAFEGAGENLPKQDRYRQERLAIPSRTSECSSAAPVIHSRGRAGPSTSGRDQPIAGRCLRLSLSLRTIQPICHLAIQPAGTFCRCLSTSMAS